MEETSADITPVCMAGGPDLRRTGSNSSTWPRYPSRGTAAGATRSPTPGRWHTPPDGRCRGEPVAWQHARRVRRAAWGNGPMATPAPRPRPTQPHDVAVGTAAHGAPLGAMVRTCAFVRVTT